MPIADQVRDWLIRRKVRMHRAPLDRFVVRVARSTADYEHAFRLLHVADAFQGFEDLDAEQLRITPQHVLPESTVLVAYEAERLVGTLTVTLDSPAGLPNDRDYPEEMAALRRAGATLVEFGSLAIVHRCWSSGVARLLEMARTGGR